MGPDLDAWLREVAPVDLLPARRRDEAKRIVRPLALVGSVWFDDRHGYALVRDARGVSYGVPLAVAAATGAIATHDANPDPEPEPPHRATARRATAGDGTSAALLSRLSLPEGQTGEEGGQNGQKWQFVPLQGSPASVGAQVFGPALAKVEATAERSVDVDQTNDLVVVGTTASPMVVKWDLHPQAGEQPGSTRLAALAAAEFDGTPRTLALLGLRVDASWYHIATVSEFVADTTDGWHWAVDDVRSLAIHGDPTIDDAVTAVAVLIADLHMALAVAGCGSASDEDARYWYQQARELVDSAALPASQRREVEGHISALQDARGAVTILSHGDLHVGQVLRVGTDGRFLVIDFDGSPTDTQSQRLARNPAARDVASMLASWDHVGRVVLHRTPDLTPVEQQRIRAWIERSQHQFLSTYRARLAERGRSELLDERLIVAYQVIQECREYAYARRYLPHWTFVPDAALPALLDRGRRSNRPALPSEDSL